MSVKANNVEINSDYVKMPDDVNIDLESPPQHVKGELTTATHYDDTDGKWHDGFCNCFDNIYPSMICSIFTPGIYVGQMYQKLTDKTNSCVGINLFLLSGNTIAYILYYNEKIAGIYLNYIMIITFLVFATKIRTMTRVKYSIPGSLCEDAFLTAFLTPFSLAQTGRTIYKHKKICDIQETIQRG